MKKQSSKHSIIKLKLLIKTLETMEVKEPKRIKKVNYDHQKKSLTIFYHGGAKRGYVGNIAVKIMQIFKKYEK